MKPRHLKVTPSEDYHDKWDVKVGNIVVGEVERFKDYKEPFQFVPDSDRLPDKEVIQTRTMKDMREGLVKLIDSETYSKILDAAFKAGYKG